MKNLITILLVVFLSVFLASCSNVPLTTSGVAKKSVGELNEKNQNVFIYQKKEEFDTETYVYLRNEDLKLVLRCSFKRTDGIIPEETSLLQSVNAGHKRFSLRAVEKKVTDSTCRWQMGAPYQFQHIAFDPRD